MFGIIIQDLACEVHGYIQHVPTLPSHEGLFPFVHPTWEKFSSLKGGGTLAASEKMTNEVAPLLTISTRRNMHLPIAPLLGGKWGRRGGELM